MPKVSVLMPVYNAEPYLAQAIDSIINQTFTDWELIIINDGSTDGSETVIQKYEDNRIYYLKNDTNLGLIKTLNKGIDLCAGKYIARMDADDIALAERLSLQIDFLDKYPQYIMCGTNATVINNNGLNTGKIRNLCESSLLKINLLFSVPFIHPSILIRKDILENNRYDESYKHVEDYELWCRIAKCGNISNINKDLMLYRWHDTNVSVLNNETQVRLTNKIITAQLQQLGLEPSEEDLYCHRITFQLYSLGKKRNISLSGFDKISAWFSKLINQNKVYKKYDQRDFIAFLWCRWIVLCLSQQKYSLLIFPKFASLNPIVLGKVLKIILFLKNK